MRLSDVLLYARLLVCAPSSPLYSLCRLRVRLCLCPSVCQLDGGPHPRLRQPLCCMHRSVAASILQDRTQTETDGGLGVASAISSVWGKCKSRPGSWNFYSEMLIEGMLEMAYASASS
ncbi:hypothetical protein BDP81DRAFT_137215 [Colletotrichum phormii]|uniref:Uncharacterized protein n=1 Tax=Colletotrichum phormii TaxID=359342 RepID=A0AAJ0E9W7_9PEZI|nr:uncharacterized protein BDP81DRAFT_137215 [Colletotrichum phormii]KAK1623280.1 hypothetical protein BDP81DRAFT_137215 [Colletotrichum phormii]